MQSSKIMHVWPIVFAATGMKNTPNSSVHRHLLTFYQFLYIILLIVLAIYIYQLILKSMYIITET